MVFLLTYPSFVYRQDGYELSAIELLTNYTIKIIDWQIPSIIFVFYPDMDAPKFKVHYEFRLILMRNRCIIREQFEWTVI